MFCSLTILATLDTRASFKPLPSIAELSGQNFFNTLRHRLACHVLYLNSKAQRTSTRPTFIVVHDSGLFTGGSRCEI